MPTRRAVGLPCFRKRNFFSACDECDEDSNANTNMVLGSACGCPGVLNQYFLLVYEI